MFATWNSVYLLWLHDSQLNQLIGSQNEQWTLYNKQYFGDDKFEWHFFYFSEFIKNWSEFLKFFLLPRVCLHCILSLGNIHENKLISIEWIYNYDLMFQQLWLLPNGIRSNKICLIIRSVDVSIWVFFVVFFSNNVNNFDFIWRFHNIVTICHFLSMK